MDATISSAENTQPSADLDSLRAAFSGRLLTEADDLEPFVVDWRLRYRGRALGMAIPDTVEDVAKVVRWCAERSVPIVPQGGNTGMSGAATPDDSGRALILSLTRLTRVRAVDPLNNSIIVEAGCTLESIQQAAEQAGRLFPLSLPSQSSCTIGGNLATNAGGVAVLRYGNARELCLGLEVITAQGEIWNGLRGLRKDNTGYDLRDIFVGSEGTLGVITAAVLKLFPKPAAQITAMAAVNDPDAALALLERAQAALGASLTAFEMLSDVCLNLVARHFPECQAPFAQPTPCAVLLEISDSEGEEHANARFEALMGDAIEAGIVNDAVVSQSMAQTQAMWKLREFVAEAQGREGKNIKHDIAVPISSVGRFIRETNAAIAREFPGVRMVVFGHLGDGNLHYNVSPPADRTGPAHEDWFLGLQPAMNRLVHDAVTAFNGSISAEHGLGQLRRDEAARYKSPVERAMMWRIKHALDPQGIMNPGKVLVPL